MGSLPLFILNSSPSGEMRRLPSGLSLQHCIADNPIFLSPEPPCTPTTLYRWVHTARAEFFLHFSLSSFPPSGPASTALTAPQSPRTHTQLGQ